MLTLILCIRRAIKTTKPPNPFGRLPRSRATKSQLKSKTANGQRRRVVDFNYSMISNWKLICASEGCVYAVRPDLLISLNYRERGFLPFMPPFAPFHACRSRPPSFIHLHLFRNRSLSRFKKKIHKIHSTRLISGDRTFIYVPSTEPFR